MPTPSFLLSSRTRFTLQSRAYSAASSARTANPRPSSSSSSSSSPPLASAHNPALASSKSSPLPESPLSPASAREQPAPSKGSAPSPTRASSWLAAAAARRAPLLADAAKNKMVQQPTGPKFNKLIGAALFFEFVELSVATAFELPVIGWLLTDVVTLFARASSSTSSRPAQKPPVARLRPASTRGRDPQPAPASPRTLAAPAAAARRTAPPAQELPRREPPFVEAARKKMVKDRTIFESYLVLPAKTRLYFWLAVGAFATVGLYAGDWLIPESEEEKLAHGEQAVKEIDV
ncbi:hypothetical protein JCM1840_007598 [Sporobolomyces johnsonii]